MTQHVNTVLAEVAVRVAEAVAILEAERDRLVSFNPWTTKENGNEAAAYVRITRALAQLAPLVQ